MLPLLLTFAVSLFQQSTTPVSLEPDGSRSVGNLPPLKAEPAPPAWLRAKSMSIAAVDTQHYIYEAYAGSGNKWLVRYTMLPEAGEAFREIEQVFLFENDPAKKPVEVRPAEIQVDEKSATWKRQTFVLVDRRELMKP